MSKSGPHTLTYILNYKVHSEGGENQPVQPRLDCTAVQ